MDTLLNKAVKIADAASRPYVIFRLMDSDVSVIHFSKDVPEKFGYSFDDFNALLASDEYSFISGYDYSYLAKCLNNSKNNTGDTTVCVNVRTKDSGSSILEGRSVFFDSKDNASLFICYLNNSCEGSEKKEMLAKALIENQRNYLAAVDFCNIITWDFDIKSGFLFNDNLFTPYFKNADRISFPRDLIDFGVIDVSDTSAFLANIGKIKAGIQEVSFENWYHFPGFNQARYIKSHYIVDFDENDMPSVAHGMGIDLTEQKNAEISFENRINAILRIAPESVATIQVNLTENMCNVVSSANSQFAAVAHSKTVDDLVTGIMALITDKVEKMHFANVISRSSLLSAFNQGNLQLKLDHHLLLRKNLDEWVCTTAELLRNPITSDVEAVIHINNIHRIKIFDSLINGTVQREFDYIALVYVKTDSYILIDKFNNDISEETPDFTAHFKQKLTAQIQIPKELDEVIEQIELSNLIEKINRHGEYTLQYNTSDVPEKNKHYVMRFSFLNNRRDIIAISCRDSTRLYNEDQEQKRQISEALKAAESANRAKSEFLSLVSHDIRTPLNGIMGMTQLAYKETDPSKIRNYLKKAEMSSGFLLGLINDLLDMAKIESGKVEFNSEIYAYKEFYEYLNSVILPLCERKNINFTIHHNTIVSNIVVDKLRLNQIIFNLLSNACKYTNKNGNVDLYIETEKVSESTCIVTFTIKDDGIGMSEEFQKHLYETFSQENRVNNTFNEGTGLGLAITHNLIELMGGEISVESKINKGTTFIVSLPCSFLADYETDKKADTGIAAEGQNNGLKNDYTGRIFLLCEDNIINQEIASEIIMNLGAKVEVADDGLMGFNMFKNSDVNYYCAIIMDIRMPNMDGLEASREIRKLERADASEIPIIAMTANAMSEDKMECIEAGMNAYIPKPINVNEFYKLLDEIVTLK